MKLYDGLGPNPQVVRMFLAELDTEVETLTVDIMAGENRQEGHLNKNPMGQLPTLELDDGSYLAEITAICEYLDDLKGGTDLIGTNPEDRAVTRMWTRRISLNICEAMTTAFRGAEGHDFFKDRLRTFPESADGHLQCRQEDEILPPHSCHKGVPQGCPESGTCGMFRMPVFRRTVHESNPAMKDR